ncbi:retrovirus-related pol polyprotein from transposon TNT 1-94 [Tanacetum coccineum]
MKAIIEQKLSPIVDNIATDVDEFNQILKEEMVSDLRYFHSLEKEVESLQYQLELQQTQFSNEIDRISREYYYIDHMNVILGVYMDIDEYSEMACNYLETLKECERLENELSKQTKNVKNKSLNELSKRSGLRNVTIKWVYYVEGLNHNFFSVGSRGSDLYLIILQETTSHNPVCLMAKASSSQAWLWHQRLSHLKFDTINLLSKNDIMTGLPKSKFFKDHLRSSFELGKAKRSSFKTKTTTSSKGRLHLLQMDLCGPMRAESINGKKYALVIVDDYKIHMDSFFEIQRRNTRSSH